MSASRRRWHLSPPEEPLLLPLRAAGTPHSGQACSPAPGEV
ncbi:MAG TPA: hypothetical protein VGH67_01995 [Solirubrobacteraceae bacterium]